MTTLPPIGTTEQRYDLYRHNRRIGARRAGWPAGALAECERLDLEHPGWRVTWLTANRWEGRPSGFAAFRPGWGLVGADDLRRDPEDGRRRRPWAFGPSVAQLVTRIAAIEEQHAAQEAEEEQYRRWLLARPV